MIKVLVTGCRDWENRRAVRAKLDEMRMRSQFINHPTYEGDLVKVIVGDADGADEFAAEWAEETPRVQFEVFEADWTKYGKPAGGIRNQDMVDQKPYICVAFWDGKSTGTKDCFTRAAQAGVNVEIVTEKIT